MMARTSTEPLPSYDDLGPRDASLDVREDSGAQRGDLRVIGSTTFEEFKHAAERAYLVAKLRANDWNVSETARALELALKASFSACSKSVKIHRRMLVRRRTPVFSKMLLVIAPGWIQHRQPKIFRVC